MPLMFLNGEGMSGGGAHPHIAGSDFLGPRNTAPQYRFLSFRDEFPGLVRVAADGGERVAGELYDVPMGKLRQLLLAEPSELELSIITLDDGSLSFGMVVRSGMETGPGVHDITRWASWRAYLDAQAGNEP